MSTMPVKELRDLSERSRVPLRRYFERRIRDRGNADAEDLVQEVFLRLARTDLPDTIENIDGYVCRIAANLVRDYVRRLAVRNDEFYVDVEAISSEDTFSPERIIIGRDAMRHVFSLLDELPPKTKKIFLLYHAEVMPQTQIARLLSMPISTIEKHMCRASLHIHHRVKHSSDICGQQTGHH